MKSARLFRAQYLNWLSLLLLVESAAHADDTLPLTGTRASESDYLVGASAIGVHGEFLGYGGLLEAQRHLGDRALWARASLGGGPLTRPSGGGGGSSPDPGDGQFVRATVGIEARASSGEGSLIAGVDVGYEYLGYDYASDDIETMRKPLRSHSPMAALRAGFELGGPRVRLRAAVELVGHSLRSNETSGEWVVDTGLGATLGLIVGL